MEQYAGLSRAQLSFEYLHTNSTTHEFLFGAIAELIDNSRDAGATELDIYTIKDDSLRGGYMLCLGDNGCGMNPDETRNVIIFGKSIKGGAESTAIGMYGNGLKSGSMRIGNDMILFTKKDGLMTCLFLSRTFHEEEKIDEVVVPMPSFKGSEKSANTTSPDDKKRHDMEMSLILRYSPFRCQKDLFAQFDKIKGPSGTVVIIYNMKLLDNGEPELDILSDARDIIYSHPELGVDSGIDVDVELPLERRSLRAYVSIIYADPRMKMYIQGRKVQTKRLVSCLYRPRMFHYASKTFKTRAETEVARAKEEVKIAELRARESESKARDLENRYGDSTDSEHLKAIRKARNFACLQRELVHQKQNIAARKQKSLKDPKTLTFCFGINLENRAMDGMFVYNCNRLIKMYQRIGPQQDSGMTCRGVVGYVDVPYLVLEPTHNKQDFADAKEFRALMRAMADHLMQYWDDIEMEKKGVDLFWTSFGYLSARWRDSPSEEDRYVRKRALSTSVCVQCDQCLKWRILPFQQSLVGKEVPDNWQCKDNPDPKHKRCSEPEQQMNIPVGVLKRKIKTKEQRAAELEEQIRVKQEELERMKGVQGSTAKGNNSQPAGKKRAPVTESSSEEESDESDKKPRGAGRAAAKAAQIALQPKKGRPAPVPQQRGKPVSTPPTQKQQTPFHKTKHTPPSTGRRRIRTQTSSEESESEEEVPAKSRRRGSPLPVQKASRPSAPQRQSAPPTQVSKSPAPPAASQPVNSTSPIARQQVAATTSAVEKSPTKTPTPALDQRSQETAKKTPAGSTESPANSNQNATNVNSSVSSAPITVDNGVTEGQAGVSKSAPMVKREPVEGSEHAAASALGGSESLLNRTVDVRVGKQTFTGQVVEVKDNRLKIKFENMPEDIHDRWFPVGSNDLKFHPAEQDDAVRTDGDASKKSSETEEKIIENFKVCLRYFLPPDWPVDKKRINSLSIRELADFPLDRFFDRYEQGLRKLLSNFQAESSASRDKLLDVRRNTAKLLKHLKKDADIDNPESENVDKVLQKYLDQL